MAAVRAQRLWAARSWQSDLLLPLSWLFAALAAFRRQAFRIGLLRTEKRAVPLIVVGNIVVGGTGKTPLVIALVQSLKAAGYHPGVISRGYGGRISQSGEVGLVESADVAAFGDEIVLIRSATKVPCAVGRKRSAAAQHLLQQHPEVDVLLSDDGLQHYGMARDIELVVFDARGIGNARLLPSGPLREPASRLDSVTAVIFNDGHTALRPGWLNSEVPSYRMQLRAAEPYLLNPTDASHSANPSGLAALAQRSVLEKVVALAGIGNPERFFKMLEAAGVRLSRTPMPDHFVFPPDFFKSIAADLILVTEKDAVKCSQVSDPRIWVVPVTAELDPALIQLVLEKLVAPR